MIKVTILMQGGFLGIMQFRWMKMMIFLMVESLGIANSAYAASKAYSLYEQAQNVPFAFNKIALYDQAIALDEDFTEARKSRAFLLFYQGKYHKAINDLNICIERGDTTPQDYYLRGKAYFALKDYERAVDDFSFVISREPTNMEALMERARSYFMLQNYYKAMADITLVLKGNAQDYLTGSAYRLGGQILLQIGREGLAEEYFKRATQYADVGVWGTNFRVYDPHNMSILGMIGLIVGCLALIFRLEIPSPKKRKKEKHWP